MSLFDCARVSRQEESRARLRRALAIRALKATGHSQSEIAGELGITQPAVSQALRASERAADESPVELLEAAAPVVKEIAASRGFTDVAVFGSVARGQAHGDSDIDLIVRAPKGTQIADLVWLQDTLATVLCRPVDVVTYGALKAGLDDDIRREAVLL